MRMHIEAANKQGTDFIVLNSDTKEILKNDTYEFCQEFINYYNLTGKLLGTASQIR